MIACNFEIIQSLAQDLGNILKRSMAFFRRNIKVTKNARALILEIQTQARSLCTSCIQLNEEVCLKERASFKSGPSDCF